MARAFLDAAALAAEIAVLAALLLRPLFYGGPEHVVRSWAAPSLALVSAGIGLLAAAALRRRAYMAVAGAAALACGAYVAMPAASTMFGRFAPPSGEARMAKLKAVKVTFDAAGGSCPDAVRVVRRGGSYGESMNLYPSDDARCFTVMNGVRIDPASGVIEAGFAEPSDDVRYASFFTSDAVAAIGPGEAWTYVVDVESVDGDAAEWQVGQTMGTNRNVYARLSRGIVGRSVKGGERKFLRLKGTAWPEFNMLDRAYICVLPGKTLNAKFRVSLFAGRALDESRYSYVPPGKTLAMPLPVPVKKGFRFEGWFDGEEKIDEKTKVSKEKTHTLTAHWSPL